MPSFVVYFDFFNQNEKQNVIIHSILSFSKVLNEFIPSNLQKKIETFSSELSLNFKDKDNIFLRIEGLLQWYLYLVTSIWRSIPLSWSILSSLAIFHWKDHQCITVSILYGRYIDFEIEFSFDINSRFSTVRFFSVFSDLIKSMGPFRGGMHVILTTWFTYFVIIYI